VPTPPTRPPSVIERAKAQSAAVEAAGPRPSPRPANLVRDDRAAAPVSAAGDRPTATNIPRSVRNAATISDGLGDGVALIGVFGASDGRRALVRGQDGAIRRVRRGDSVDGWSVAAIDFDSVRLTSGGRSQTLKVPTR
jgi:hypothetical protein